MTNKLKRRARAHSKKTGMSYQAALNVLKKPAMPVPELPSAKDSLVFPLSAISMSAWSGEKTKVFVSTTREDLGPHYEFVRDALSQIDVELVPDWPTVPAEITPQMNPIENADLIIFIIGFHYGRDLFGDGKGIIELEYEDVLRAQLPRLVFLADEGCWPAEHVDKNRERILRFRSLLQEQEHVHRFTTPQDLAAKVVNALKNSAKQPGPAKNEKHCPSPPLPEGQIAIPRIDPDTNLQNLRWFIERKNGIEILPTSPLGKAMALAEQWRTPPLVPPGAEREYLARLVRFFRLADWGINALFAKQTDPNRKIVCRVDRTFITDELLDADNKEKGSALKMPGGVGTLYLAGRLAQAGGGQSILITGNKAKGHDIRWVSRTGDLMLIERKDRAYEAGLNDTHDDRIAKVIELIREAGPKIPQDQGAAGRVLMIGFQQGVVHPFLAQQHGAMYAAAVWQAFANNPDPTLPDAVIVEHLAHSISTAVRLILRQPSKEFERVLPVLRRAMPESPPPPKLMVGAEISPDGRLRPYPVFLWPPES